jgi:hypothetical protein
VPIVPHSRGGHLAGVPSALSKELWVRKHFAKSGGEVPKGDIAMSIALVPYGVKTSGGNEYEDREYHYNKYCPSLRSTTSDIVGVNQDKWEGEIIPNHLERRRRGELLPYTNWSHQTETGNFSSSYWIQWKTGTVCGGSGYPQGWTIGGDPFYFPRITEAELDLWLEEQDVNLDALVVKAASDCYAKGVDMLTFLVELRKLEPDLIRLAERAKRLKPRGNTGTVEASFGWGPLIRDVVDIVTELNSAGSIPPRFVTGRSGVSITSEDVVSIVSPTSGVFYTATWTGNTVITASFRGSCCARFAPNRFRCNPITTAWELIPWSWLVDYIIGVGSYLEQQSLMAVSTAMTTSHGWKLHVIRQADLSVVWHQGYTGTIEGHGVHQVTRKLRKRVDPPKFPQISVRATDLNLLRLLTDIMVR